MTNEQIIQEAKTFATQAHAGQFRKCGVTPYITHPIGVANIVAKAGGTTDQIVIALLHDVIEDCEGYDYEVIADAFGEKIAEGVQDLSNTSKQDRPELNRAQRKTLDNARLANIPQDIKEVKLADIYYNVHDLKGMDEGFIPRFLQEKFNQVQSLMAEFVMGDEMVYPNSTIIAMYEQILRKCRSELEARGWVHVHTKDHGPKWERSKR